MGKVVEFLAQNYKLVWRYNEKKSFLDHESMREVVLHLDMFRRGRETCMTTP